MSRNPHHPCPILLASPQSDLMPLSEVSESFQSKSAAEVGAGMKALIFHTINGDSTLPLLVPVIRFVIPFRDHAVKRLLLLYLEVFDQAAPTDRALPEMILLCNALLQDLKHPNEFIRAATLRLMCRLRYPEVLESMIEAIRACLEHPQAIVRRNAVLALHSIKRHCPKLLPDLERVTERALANETDVLTRRHIYRLIFEACPEAAGKTYQALLQDIRSLPDPILRLHLAVTRRAEAMKPGDPIAKLGPLLTALRPRLMAALKRLLATHEAFPLLEMDLIDTLCDLAAPSDANELYTTSKALLGIAERASDNNARHIVLRRLTCMFRNEEQVRAVTQSQTVPLILLVLRLIKSPNIGIQRPLAKLALGLIVRLVTSSTLQAVIDDLTTQLTQAMASDGADYDAAIAGDMAAVLRDLVAAHDHVAAIVVQKLVPTFIHGRSLPEANRRIAELVEQLIRAHDSTRKTLIAAIQPYRWEVRPDAVKIIVWLLWRGVDGGGLADAQIVIEFAAAWILSSVAAAKPLAKIAAEARLHVWWPHLSEAILAAALYHKKLPAIASPIAACTLASVLTATALSYDDLPALPAFVALILAEGLRGDAAAGGWRNDDARRWFEHCIWVLVGGGGPKSKQRFLAAARGVIQEEPPSPEEEKGERPVLGLDDRPIVTAAMAASPSLKLFAFLDFPHKSTAATRRARSVSAATALTDDDDDGRPTQRLDPAPTTFLSSQRSLTGPTDMLYVEADVAITHFDLVLTLWVRSQTDHTLEQINVHLFALHESGQNLVFHSQPQPFSLAARATSEPLVFRYALRSTTLCSLFGYVCYSALQQGTTENVLHLDQIDLDLTQLVMARDAPLVDVQRFRELWLGSEWDVRVLVDLHADETPDHVLQRVVDLCHMQLMTKLKLPSHGADPSLQLGLLYAKSLFDEPVMAVVCISRGDAGREALVQFRSPAKGLIDVMHRKLKQLRVK